MRNSSLWRPGFSDGFTWHKFIHSLSFTFLLLGWSGSGAPKLFALLSVLKQHCNLPLPYHFHSSWPWGPVPSLALPLAKWQKIKAFVKPQWKGRRDQVIWAIHYTHTQACVHSNTHPLPDYKLQSQTSHKLLRGTRGETHAREITTTPSNFRHEQVFVCVGSKPGVGEGKADSPLELKRLNWVPL